MSCKRDNFVVPYATTAPTPRTHSKYGIASIAVSAFSILWWPLGIFVPIPVEPDKYDRIGSMIAILGGILALAAYRQADRKRTLAHIGMGLGIAGLALYVLFPAL